MAIRRDPASCPDYPATSLKPVFGDTLIRTANEELINTEDIPALGKYEHDHNFCMPQAVREIDNDRAKLVPFIVRKVVRGTHYCMLSLRSRHCNHRNILRRYNHTQKRSNIILLGRSNL